MGEGADIRMIARLTTTCCCTCQMGKYASDAYQMFCRGRWRDLQPKDKDLAKYHAFLVETGRKNTLYPATEGLVSDCWPVTPLSIHPPEGGDGLGLERESFEEFMRGASQ